MKTCLTCIVLWFIAAVPACAGIVNNNGTTSEDSLAITFALYDSLGNPTVAASGDSAWLFVCYPGGGLAHVDSVRIISDGKVSVRRLDVGAHSLEFYTYRNAVSALDGAGLNGVYQWTLVAYDSSLALASTGTGEFQLYSAADFSLWAGRLDEAISTRSPIGDTNSNPFDQATDKVTLATITHTGATIPTVNVVGGLGLNAIAPGTIASGAVTSQAVSQAAAAKIAYATWNLPHDTMPGFQDSAFGRQWHNWAQIDAGTGAVPCTLQVLRTTMTDTVAVTGAFLRIYNKEETATLATGITDANGRAVFAVAADTLKVYAALAGHLFDPQPETVVVTLAGETDTLWCTAFDPGVPLTPNLCRVYGWVSDLSAVPVTGATVEAEVAASPLRFDSRVISPYRRTTVTDTMGYWYLDLFPSALLEPDTTSYTIQIRFTSGAILRRSIPVPDSVEWFFTW